MATGFELPVTTTGIPDGTTLTLTVKNDYNNVDVLTETEIVAGSSATFVIDDSITDTWPDSINYEVTDGTESSVQVRGVKKNTGGDWSELIEVPEADVALKLGDDAEFNSWCTLANNITPVFEDHGVAGKALYAVSDLALERSAKFVVKRNDGGGHARPSSTVISEFTLPTPATSIDIAQKVNVPSADWSGGNLTDYVNFMVGRLGIGCGGGTKNTSGSSPGGFTLFNTWMGLSDGTSEHSLHLTSADSADTQVFKSLDGGSAIPLHVWIPNNGWHDVRVRLIMNSNAATADGELHFYYSESLVFSKTNFKYFSTGTPEIDTLFFHYYHGTDVGGGDDYAFDSTGEEARFADVRYRLNPV